MISTDYDAEGLHWMAENHLFMPAAKEWRNTEGRYMSAQEFFHQWRDKAEDVWVVHFELAEVLR